MADPWDEFRRRRKDAFWGSFLPPEFEEDFDRMRETMQRMMADALRTGGVTPGQPFVYGFSLHVGPDGKPEIQHFGNTAPTPFAKDAAEGAREPLVDVLPGDKTVTVTVELPGVEKEDINLHVADQKVTIRVDAGRRYYKEIQLPAPVKPDTANATHRNGVLDITIERAGVPRDSGHRVSVK